MRGAGINLRQLAADHRTNDVAEFRAGHFAGRYALAIAQHGEALADALTLFEEVADIDDTHAALAQTTDDAK